MLKCSSKKICPSKDCKICFNKSFASSDKAVYWDYELNNLTPREVFKNSGLKFWFNCGKHVFESKLSNITCHNNWCYRCSINGYSKEAIKWLNQIMIEENKYIQHAENEGEYNIKNIKSRVDGYCKETNTVYEFYGDFWHGNPDKFLKNDINSITNTSFGVLHEITLEREEKIKNLGYNLISIWEKDFKTLSTEQ